MHDHDKVINADTDVASRQTTSHIAAALSDNLPHTPAASHDSVTSQTSLSSDLSDDAVTPPSGASCNLALSRDSMTSQPAASHDSFSLDTQTSRHYAASPDTTSKQAMLSRVSMTSDNIAIPSHNVTPSHEGTASHKSTTSQFTMTSAELGDSSVVTSLSSVVNNNCTNDVLDECVTSGVTSHDDNISIGLEHVCDASDVPSYRVDLEKEENSQEGAHTAPGPPPRSRPEVRRSSAEDIALERPEMEKGEGDGGETIRLRHLLEDKAINVFIRHRLSLQDAVPRHPPPPRSRLQTRSASLGGCGGSYGGGGLGGGGNRWGGSGGGESRLNSYVRHMSVGLQHPPLPPLDGTPICPTAASSRRLRLSRDSVQPSTGSLSDIQARNRRLSDEMLGYRGGDRGRAGERGGDFQREKGNQEDGEGEGEGEDSLGALLPRIRQRASTCPETKAFRRRLKAKMLNRPLTPPPSDCLVVTTRRRLASLESLDRAANSGNHFTPLSISGSSSLGGSSAGAPVWGGTGVGGDFEEEETFAEEDQVGEVEGEKGDREGTVFNDLGVFPTSVVMPDLPVILEA